MAKTGDLSGLAVGRAVAYIIGLNAKRAGDSGSLGSDMLIARTPRATGANKRKNSARQIQRQARRESATMLGALQIVQRGLALYLPGMIPAICRNCFKGFYDMEDNLMNEDEKRPPEELAPETLEELSNGKGADEDE